MKHDVEVVFARLELIESFYQALARVAAERIYIEMIEPPPFERVLALQTEMILKNAPAYYAIHGQAVVGWCDIFPNTNPRKAHRGGLGMGIVAGFRGQGIGGRLLSAALEQARQFGLEKVELEVYATNTAAINLYRKMGFTEEGLVKNYRKLEGSYFDSLQMAKFLL